MLERASDMFHRNADVLGGRLVAGVVAFVLVLIGARLAAKVLERALLRRGPRAATLAGIVRAVVSLGGSIVAVVMGLAQLGIDVAAVLAGAGVVGLAVGFGAQTLVKDCISGFFLILDDVVQVGDVAQVDEQTGVVERVGLRVTQVRAFSGQLWYVPNGAIVKVGNFNRGWNRAVVVVGLAYEADVGRALEVLHDVGERWAAEHEALAVEPPVAQGVLELGDSSVSLRLVAKVPPLEIWNVEHELRRRVKAAFDAAGLEIAYPKRVVQLVGASKVGPSTVGPSTVGPSTVGPSTVGPGAPQVAGA